MAINHHLAELLGIIGSNSARLDPQPAELAPRLARLPGIRAVIFDVYGTLFISASGDISLVQQGGATAALLTVLRGAGMQWPEGAGDAGDALLALIRASHASDHARGIDFPEVDIRDIWAGLLRLAMPERVVSPALIEALALRYEMLVNPVWPMPGVRQLLASLRRRGFALGILSNAQFYTGLLFEHFLGHPADALGFDQSLCVWSYLEGRGKPSQELFDSMAGALRRLGMEAGEALYVGNDMRNDILPAARAGMRTALFAGDARSLRLREHPADAIAADVIITGLDQIGECIGHPAP